MVCKHGPTISLTVFGSLNYYVVAWEASYVFVARPLFRPMNPSFICAELNIIFIIIFTLAWPPSYAVQMKAGGENSALLIIRNKIIKYFLLHKMIYWNCNKNQVLGESYEERSFLSSQLMLNKQNAVHVVISSQNKVSQYVTVILLDHHTFFRGCQKIINKIYTNWET